MGRVSIQDEFTNLPISRQRKYQLRKAKAGLCTECGAPAAFGSRCTKHLVRARERQRTKLGLKRRYHGTTSYLCEMIDKAKKSGRPLPERAATLLKVLSKRKTEGI